MGFSRRGSSGAPDPIDEVNSKSDQQFIADHLRLRISIVQAESLNPEELNCCFELVEETSRKHYEASSRGWKPRKKIIEMKSREMRYVIVKDHMDRLRGFTSLMPTYEEGEPVIYCYEIHLKPELRGTGLAAHLMSFQENIATHITTVVKVMLTCFTKNEHALLFYKKIGFEIDEISPQPKKLRSGKESAPEYVIMSKKV